MSDIFIVQFAVNLLEPELFSEDELCVHVDDGGVFFIELWVFLVSAEEWEPVADFMGFDRFCFELLDVDLLEVYFLNLLLYHGKK